MSNAAAVRLTNHDHDSSMNKTYCCLLHQPTISVICTVTKVGKKLGFFHPSFFFKWSNKSLGHPASNLLEQS